MKIVFGLLIAYLFVIAAAATFGQIQPVAALLAVRAALPVQPAFAPLTRGIVKAALPLQPAAIGGVYAGNLGPIDIQLFIYWDRDDLAGSLSSSSRGVDGLRAHPVRQIGDHVTFALPSIAASWAGVVTADGDLVGIWRQGSQTSPLTLRRR
jgi:hypothetical protein